ncbi:restriction endonuclease subunit S [Aeromicrobium sp.]|uniref:restriction endonuclease subunit S n=1 Tax=Aeromicrobium sp. TaxID=1871063 RepID=UPI0028A85C8A|nr:restriction endonuclease subunit S [Aeromicrobium sp.]
MKTGALGDVIVTRGGSVNPAKFPDEEFELYSIPAHDRGGPEIVLGSEIRSAKQIVQPGDVMISKIIPHIRRARVVGPLKGRRQIASGEWIVLRSENLDARFLRHFLLSDDFHSQFMNTVAGVGGSLVRARPAQVKTIPLPLQPLPEQRRIAAILDHADALRAKRRQVLTHLDSLTHAIFTEMFGDVRTNEHGYDVATVDDISERVTDGEHKTPRRSESGFPLLSARNVRDGWIDFDNTDFVDADEYAMLSRRIEPREGDVLISCSGTIGRVAQVRQRNRFAMVRSAALVRPGAAVHPTFLERTLASPTLKSIMVAQANSSAQANLFQNQIKRLPVIVPPVALQEEFAERAARVGAVVDVTQQTTAADDELFTSLQSRAFRGEL